MKSFTSSLIQKIVIYGHIKWTKCIHKADEML